jgi:hypothetical protein
MHQEGVEVRPITQVDGSAEFNEVFFSNARCPKGNVVGGVNNGWKVAMTTLGFERGSSSTTGYRRFLKEWEVVVKEATRLNKNKDLRVRNDLVKAWEKVKIMEINGYRSLTDSLNNTHNTALLGACNKMFWSEAHRASMELALDVLGMEAQILTGTGDSEGMLQGLTTRSLSCRRPSSSRVPRPSGAVPRRSSATSLASGLSGFRRNRSP